jgi:hypothetical protein
LIDALVSTPLRFPLLFTGGFAEMSALFGTFIDKQAFPDDYAERISNLLPASIRGARVFLTG